MPKFQFSSPNALNHPGYIKYFCIYVNKDLYIEMERWTTSNNNLYKAIEVRRCVGLYDFLSIYSLCFVIGSRVNWLVNIVARKLG